jgi:CxxC motif-containing protein (DUF1111 family)
MKQGVSALVILGIVWGLALISSCRKAPELGDPLRGLTREQRDQFTRGRGEFQRVFAPETGLGPLFNADACAECHESPVAGGAGDEVEVHAAAFLQSGTFCDPLVEKGGPVIQQQATPALNAALGITSEPFPLEATGKGLRTTPDLFGFGLLDAVPDATILALADPDDRDHDGISGRPNRFFDGRLGRFGRKALVPTLREFNDGAFAFEQSVTNPAVLEENSIGGKPIPNGVDPLPEPEINQESIDVTDAFVRFLAPPAPPTLGKEEQRGQKIFADIGCAGCHVPTLKTGKHPIKALSNKDVAAYTDLLLHDMGPELADICLGLATPSEFRTEPLMGLRLSKQIENEAPRFLHDGRARSIEEAITLHGGEGAAARDKFRALSEADRKKLLQFLRSL